MNPRPWCTPYRLLPAPTSLLLNDNIYSLLLTLSVVNSMLPGSPIPAFLSAPPREIQRDTHCSMVSFLSPGDVLCASRCPVCVFPALLSMFWPHPIDTNHEIHADKTASFPHHCPTSPPPWIQAENRRASQCFTPMS